MKCDVYEENIMEYLDGELDEGRRAKTEQHMKKCAHCSEFLLTMQKEYEMLSALSPLSPGKDFTQKVMTHIRSKQADENMPKIQFIPAIIIFAAVIALYIPALIYPTDIIYAAFNGAAWLVKILSGFFNAALWMMDFTAKVIFNLQSIMSFLGRIPEVLIREYPGGALFIISSFLLECFLWGKLISLKKIG